MDDNIQNPLKYTLEIPIHFHLSHIHPLVYPTIPQTNSGSEKLSKGFVKKLTKHSLTISEKHF